MAERAQSPFSTPGLLQTGTQPPILMATPRVSCALASAISTPNFIQTHTVQPTVVPDTTQVAVSMAPQIFDSCVTAITVPNVVNVATVPCVAPVITSAGIALKCDEVSKAPTTTTVVQPQQSQSQSQQPVLPPKSEATAVSQPQPTPTSEPPISGTSTVGTPQVTIQPVVPTVVVRSPTIPKPYTGQTSYKAYRQYFERVCVCNNWNTALEKAQHLIVALKLAAAEAVWGVEVKEDSDYERIWEVLKRRFGFLDTEERAKRNLELRRLGQDESVTLFEQGLRSLFREAWPQMDLKKPEFDNMVSRGG